MIFINNRHRGIFYALGAALLFGASAPLIKPFTAFGSPLMIAGLLYLGSGLGLGIFERLIVISSKKARQRTSFSGKDWFWLSIAIFCGGVLAPVLLMVGLQKISASTVSLFLNFEAVATAMIAWLVFRENVDRRIFFGFLLITAGAALLSWSGRSRLELGLGTLAIIGACLFWGIDNNLTRKISANDPIRIAMLKGLMAGGINTVLALSTGLILPKPIHIFAIGFIGFLGYGISLVLFVLALRHLGAARTSAYFSTAPFVGAILSLIIYRDALTLSLVIAGLLMGIGVWLHLTEKHEHEHVHEPMEHEHLHFHDEHHQHEHTAEDPPGEPHCHRHHHDHLVHKHGHDPDIHHQHSH